MKANKVALVGHSYGSYLSAGSANHTDVDAVVLTGFSGSFANFAPFVSGSSWRVARDKNPQRWGNLDPVYLTPVDVYATTYAYFKEPFFEHRVAEWTHNVAAEPFAVGELPSLLASYSNFHNVTAPVLVQQGLYDVSACGGYCIGIVEEKNLRDTVFRSAKALNTVNNLPAG
jgi:pimeloyl-ACP methyl ester carboxylesterase